MVNFGFLSLTIPKEYGGSGFDYDIAWRWFMKFRKEVLQLVVYLKDTIRLLIR